MKSQVMIFSHSFRYIEKGEREKERKTAFLMPFLKLSCQLEKLHPNFREAHSIPAFLPSFVTRNFASFSSRQLSGLTVNTDINQSNSVVWQRDGPILPRDRRRCVYHTPQADACAEARPLVITLESTTRYVYPRRLRGTRGNLCEYAVVTQKARNGSVFPGPGLFVLYVRSAPCCVSWPADISSVRNIQPDEETRTNASKAFY